MSSVVANVDFLGFSGGRGIFRIDLSQLPFDLVQAITIVDDGIRSGGTGGASGADIDFLGCSSVCYSEASLPCSELSSLKSDVVFHPGYLTQWQEGDSAYWNVPYLFGTTAGNAFDPTQATLDSADGNNNASTGTLSIGEAGQLSLLLKEALATRDENRRYIYFGEYGSQYKDLDNVKVILSSERVAEPYASGRMLFGNEQSELIALGQGNNTHIGQGNDSVSGFAGNDRIYTAIGDDRLFGGFGDDQLYGENGRDRLFGEDGNDKLYGGADNDWLSGGKGHDIFVFNTKLGNHRNDKKINFDNISDFSAKYDSVWLDNFIFKKLGSGTEAKPKLLKKAYFSIDKAHDKNDYIIYHKKSGILSYDADGSGKGHEVEFAQLKKGLSLTYKDFFVI